MDEVDNPDEGADAFAIGVTSDERGTGVTIAVRGEVDAATVDTLWATVEQVIGGASRLTIDLTDTTFMDSAGLNALVRAHREMGQCKEAIVVLRPSPAIRRLLAMAGIGALMTIED